MERSGEARPRPRTRLPEDEVLLTIGFPPLKSVSKLRGRAWCELECELGHKLIARPKLGHDVVAIDEVTGIDVLTGLSQGTVKRSALGLAKVVFTVLHHSYKLNLFAFRKVSRLVHDKSTVAYFRFHRQHPKKLDRMWADCHHRRTSAGHRSSREAHESLRARL